MTTDRDIYADQIKEMRGHLRRLENTNHALLHHLIQAYKLLQYVAWQHSNHAVTEGQRKLIKSHIAALESIKPKSTQKAENR